MAAWELVHQPMLFVTYHDTHTSSLVISATCGPIGCPPHPPEARAPGQHPPPPPPVHCCCHPGDLRTHPSDGSRAPACPVFRANTAATGPKTETGAGHHAERPVCGISLPAPTRGPQRPVAQLFLSLHRRAPSGLWLFVPPSIGWLPGPRMQRAGGPQRKRQTLPAGDWWAAGVISYLRGWSWALQAEGIPAPTRRNLTTEASAGLPLWE